MPFPAMATRVSPTASTPKEQAHFYHIASTLSDASKQPFWQLMNKYQPTLESCKTIVCEGERLNAERMNEHGIDATPDHFVAGYKNVWMPDGFEEQRIEEALLNEQSNLRQLFHDLSICRIQSKNISQWFEGFQKANIVAY